jgi:hypothetical protein
MSRASWPAHTRVPLGLAAVNGAVTGLTR